MAKWASAAAAWTPAAFVRPSSARTRGAVRSRSSPIGRCGRNACWCSRKTRDPLALFHRRQDIARDIHALPGEQHGVVVIAAGEGDDQVQIRYPHRDLPAVTAREERANLPAVVAVSDAV